MPVLSSNNQKLALETARESIKTKLDSGNELRHPNQDPEFLQKLGCFVTLRKNGELRGCVGTFENSRPLIQNIVRMSVASAFQDMRFSPVTKSELPEIKIEISILGHLEKIDSIDQIEIGKHGVYVKAGSKSGTFLPDVATEQGWNRDEFVMNCAREKAHMTTAECAQAEIFRYEVQKISE